MSSFTFHILPNAHLDPVWLWDWREGLNEGWITIRTILDLMDEDPELTFLRGEAAIYQHIEACDPALFQRIKQYVEAGRWDVVGGTYIQPDTNLLATETLARHFARSQNYFMSRFGRRSCVAWAADSFGHSAGLPEILAQAGIEIFAFTRPFDVPHAGAFWWEGCAGSRVLAYRPPVGWYGTERNAVPERFDAYLAAAQNGNIQNIGCFVGLGNHGGGPTRRHLEDIAQWAKAHPEVRVEYSGLHRLFDALREEVAHKGKDFLPVHQGEMNFCLRGCYSSAARLKFLYRKAEAAITSVERSSSIISAATDHPTADLGSAWDAVLMNSFHDILPGTSIEHAFDDQIAWLGGALHQCPRIDLNALNALARRVDTTVAQPEGDHPWPVAFLVWNPHPHSYRGPIELENALDYRPIEKYTNRANELPVEVRGPGGQPVAFQEVVTEHNFMPELAWRKRVVLPVELPPLGWSVFSMAWVENPESVTADTAIVAPEAGCIANGTYTVQAKAGDSGIHILHDGQLIFGAAGLSAITVEDPWGSWGSMTEDPASLDLSTVRDTWTIDRVETLEAGPQRGVLWVRLKGGNSRLELTFSLYNRREVVEVSARVFWNERSARLKLVMPIGDPESTLDAEFDVPCGTVQRGPAGEVPGGRWVRIQSEQNTFGFASDALYNFDCKEGALRATIVRATRYATDVIAGPEDEPWRPALDAGELRFRFLLAPGDEHLPRLARELEEPPTVLAVPPIAGDLPHSGSLAALEPASLRLLALKPAEDGNGFVLRVQNTAAAEYCR